MFLLLFPHWERHPTRRRLARLSSRPLWGDFDISSIFSFYTYHKALYPTEFGISCFSHIAHLEAYTVLVGTGWSRNGGAASESGCQQE